MHVAALERNLSCCGVEVFVFQFADSTAVHRVGPVGSKLLHVEFVCAQSDFLVRVETDTDVAVLDFRVLLQIFHCGNDFSNTGLVVSAKECLSVGHDKCLSGVFLQFGEFVGREHYVVFSIEHDVATVVVLHDTRVDMTA